MTYGFLVVWGVVLHLTDGDVPTRAQTLFRGAVVLTGLLGLASLRRGGATRFPRRRR